MMKKIWKKLIIYLKIKFSCDIKKNLPKSVNLPHPVGIVISNTAEIGENVTIYQNVTIGWTLGEKERKAGSIGDNVIIYSGAKIIGNITIGDNAIVGANAVVIHDVPENMTVVGVPASKK